MDDVVFRGCMPALMTPCDERGVVDHDALVATATRLVDGGMSGVVYCGSTLSENPALRRIVAEIGTLLGQRPCVLAGGAF